MTNPDNAIGTNAAYGTRTSTNAFNDILQLASGRGILSGWACAPKSGMTVKIGGTAGVRDVAIAEDNLGNRTTINNRSGESIDVAIGAASASSNRYDAIVAYVKNPAQATAATPIPQDAPSVCGLIVVQGGTTGVSEAQIRTAITADGGGGTTAYYVVIATVYVASGTTTITSANISQAHASISASDIANDEITASMAKFTSYSTSEEIAVGKWIDGKTIYRKCYTVSQGPTPNSPVLITISGIDSAISITGCLTNGIATMFIGGTRSSNDLALGAYWQDSTNQIQIEAAADRSGYSGYVIFEYTKTS